MFWQDAKVSIVLLPSGTQGEQILELASRWTTIGLLGRALWVMPENVNDTPGAPPRIQAAVLGVDESLQPLIVGVDLFEALAEEQLELVRLVQLRSSVPENEQDAVQDAVAARVRASVRRSMPLPNPRATVADQSTELRHLTLICAPTEFELRERAGRESGFGVVVVASPEDRSSPWSGDAFVRDDDRFVGFTLMHLASVAGLWNGISDGSFDLLGRENSGADSVWISRVFINAVLTESLSRRVAAQVLSDAARPDSLLVDPSVSPPPEGTAFIETSQIDGYVDRMVAAALQLDNRALTFDRSAAGSDPQPVRFGFWEQIGRFFVFSASKLVLMPKWATRWFSSRTYRQMTKTLHSDEGFAVVGPDLAEVLDARDRLLMEDSQRLVSDEARARAESDTPVGLAHIRTTPALWAGLRELVFGSLDGSADLSAQGFAAVEGAVPVFGRVSDVLALPGEPWQTAGRDVPAGFPKTVDWYALVLDDPREQLDAWLAEANAASAATDVPAETPEPVGSDSGDESVEAGARDEEAGSSAPVESEHSPAEESPLATESAATESAAAEAAPAPASPAETGGSDAARASRRASLDDFDAWSAGQNGSFIWRLLAQMSKERRHAERETERLMRAIDAIVPQKPGELVRLRRGFHRTMAITWTVFVIAVIVALAVIRLINTTMVENDPSFDPEPSTNLLWWGIAIAAAAGVLLTLLALIDYHQGWSRFERRITVDRLRLMHLGRAARHSRHEASRLRSVHRQSVDWLVLLSKAIHRPWNVPENWMEHESYSVERSALPFAMHLATVSEHENAAIARMRATMTSKLVRRGWRHDAFEELVRETSVHSGSGHAFGLGALDEDLPHSSNHTRRMLLHSLDDESLLTRVASPRLAFIVKAVQNDDQALVRPRVASMGSSPLSSLRRVGEPEATGSTDQPWDEFLLGSLVRSSGPTTPLSASVLTDLQLGERYHEHVTTFLVASSRLQDNLRLRPDAMLKQVSVDFSTGAPVDLVWRLDVVGPVPRAAIRLWSNTDPVTSMASPEDATTDSGV